MATIRFELGAAVTVPRFGTEGDVLPRLTGIVRGISITEALGTRYRVDFNDENGVPQSLEYDDGALE